MSDLFHELRRHVEAETAVAAVTVVEVPERDRDTVDTPEIVASPHIASRMLIFTHGEGHGGLDDVDLERRVVVDAREQLRRGVSKAVAYDRPYGELTVFIDVYPAPHRLLVFGGVHIAVPLVELAKVMGFRAIVIDARGRFATQERFPKADEIAVAYADEYLANARLDESTYVVVLSHDPKLDDPALIGALRSNVRYIGAIGSRKTHARRVERLREAGLTDEQIGTIHAPIGLDIEARNPEEIALAIMAEMIAAKNGASAKAPVSGVEGDNAAVSAPGA